MKNSIIKLANIGMGFIYFFMKLFKTKNKITFISRQGNKNSLDFELVQNEIRKMDKSVQIVALNRRFRDIDPMKEKISYCFHILVQMYHIATSKVVVLETYCMPISMLHHKKSLKVIQMWHALGSLKKFGYSIEHKKEGSRLAKIAKMHKNYDMILTSSEESLKNFSEAFHYPKEYFKILPLPRVDYLMDKKKQEEIKKNLQKEYSILTKKKNIVYAPTFRKTKEDINKIKELMDAIDYEKYNLILKLHPLTKIELSDTRPILDKKHPTIDWLSTADIVITDYSAIVYEAALLKKRIILYAYDLKTYEGNRDFYLDYKKEMPGTLVINKKQLQASLLKEEQTIEKTISFSKTYVDYHGQNCTHILAKLILKMKED